MRGTGERNAMATRILTAADIAALLHPRAGMEALRAALSARARGDALQPLRQIHRIPDHSGGALALMPAWLGDPPALGGKVVSFFPGNEGSELDTHQGVVLVFETARGRLTGILDAGEITARRTAAASALATDALARPDAGELALIGSGVQAAAHLDAMVEARPIRRVRIASRDPGSAAALAERAREEHRVDAVVATDVRRAVEGADLVCTLTTSRTPVLHGDWLAAGAHVNAVGACAADARELDGAAMARATVFVDSEESARRECGDLLLAIAEGAIPADHLQAELGDVLIGRHPGRRHRDEVTVYASLGIGLEDLAVAAWLLDRAESAGIGLEVDLAAGPSRGGARP